MPNAKGARWREPRERFVDELLDPDSEGAERMRSKFLSEAHNRIVSPLFAYTFAVIGLAALLLGNVDRRGQWRRILVAIAAAVAFEALALFLVNATAKSSNLIPLMYLNPGPRDGRGDRACCVAACRAFSAAAPRRQSRARTGRGQGRCAFLPPFRSTWAGNICRASRLCFCSSL